MKIVGFEANNKVRLGVVEGDTVIDIQAVDPSIAGDLGDYLRATNGDMTQLKAAVAKASASARIPLAGLKFALPVAKPGKIICLGLNYLDHVKEGPQKDNIPKFQSIFFRMLTSLVPHGTPLMRPVKSIQFDYEGELVVVIGKRAKHLTMENATDCVAGYSVGNEGSIREYQRHTTQWGMGKNFDRTGSVGPWMVTADEIPDPAALTLETRLNGQVMQHAPISDLIFDVPALIAYVSTFTTLYSGDVIVTGTTGGVGAFREPPVWMKPGDVVEVEISRIGTLRNPVIDEPI